MKKTKRPFPDLIFFQAYVYVCLLALICTTAVSAQVRSSIDTTSIQIGEELRYSIEVESDTTQFIVFPEGQTFLPLEVIESYTIDTTYEGERMRLLKTYGLTQFDSGRYLIPKQRILIADRPYLTDSVLVEVRDVKVDTTQQKMFEIKEAIEVDDPPIDLLAILMWLIPILLILAILGLLFFRRRKRKQATLEPLPPYEEAITALRDLDNSELLTHDRSKEYYSTLTEIVKRYLDREIDDTALESTSDELIARLQLHKDAGHFDLDTETIRHLDEVLKRADLVKFAKMQQGQDQARSDRNTIEEIINHTHEAVPEPTEEELLENEKYLESLRKKRQNRKVIWGVISGILVLLITCAVFMSIYGVTYVKDTILGHPTKELLEQRWMKSEYGNPAIVIETPEVLLRKEASIPDEMKAQVRSMSSFDYGSLWEHFYIQIATTEFAQPQEINLETTLESMLVALEEQGATNLIVKQEAFETGEGVKGLKGYGTFSAEDSENAQEGERNYQIIIFGQAGALQQVVISTEAEDPYAEEVVERILNSLELEVTSSQQKSQTP